MLFVIQSGHKAFKIDTLLEWFLLINLNEYKDRCVEVIGTKREKTVDNSTQNDVNDYSINFLIKLLL